MALVKGPKPLGRLYRLDADGSIRVMLQDVGTSNGIAWSLDRRTLYFIDTPLLRVDAFDYDDVTGAIANRRTVISIPPGIGRPDGSTLDAEGMLWIAMYDGWAATRWNPRTGELLQTVRLPVARVTSCAFGGRSLTRFFSPRRERSSAKNSWPPNRWPEVFSECGPVCAACRRFPIKGEMLQRVQPPARIRDRGGRRAVAAGLLKGADGAAPSTNTQHPRHYKSRKASKNHWLADGHSALALNSRRLRGSLRGTALHVDPFSRAHLARTFRPGDRP